MENITLRGLTEMPVSWFGNHELSIKKKKLLQGTPVNSTQCALKSSTT